MPLTQASLATKIKAEIESFYGGPPDDSAKLDQFAQAIAKAVVDEIQANALVTGTVTSGAGAGGAVTGTVS